jgi:hypothetical protein
MTQGHKLPDLRRIHVQTKLMTRTINVNSGGRTTEACQGGNPRADKAEITTRPSRNTGRREELVTCQSTGQSTGSCRGYVVDHNVPLACGGPTAARGPTEKLSQVELFCSGSHADDGGERAHVPEEGWRGLIEPGIWLQAGVKLASLGILSETLTPPSRTQA